MKLSQNTWIILLVIVLVVIAILGLYWFKKGFKKRLIKNALAEYIYFQQGNLKETDPKAQERIRRYWAVGVMATPQPVSVPWSAAFISYLFRISGAGPLFNYSVRHSDYIRTGVNARKANIPWPMKGYRPSEVPVELGDLVCYPRQSGVGYDSDFNYMSHCDIVVNVDPNRRKVNVLGGNISNSVSATEYSIDSQGRLISSKPHVVIKNRI